MINRHFVTHFIKHYWSATRIDVLHSPFIFELYNACIARQHQPAELDAIEKLRQQLQNDSTRITQQDFGARQNENKFRKKTVSFFAKQHAKPKRIAQILYRMVNKYQYKTCVELGTSLGLTSLYLAKALPSNGKLITIEGAPEIAEFAKQNFIRLNLNDSIKQHTGRFDDVLHSILSQHETIDFAFIDGNHTYDATMNYFHQFLPKMQNHSVLVFDDIYWSEGMTKAWEEIKQHPDVTATVDLFYIGLVYFRKEQLKEEFKLRVW